VFKEKPASEDQDQVFVRKLDNGVVQALRFHEGNIGGKVFGRKKGLEIVELYTRIGDKLEMTKFDYSKLAGDGGENWDPVQRALDNAESESDSAKSDLRQSRYTTDLMQKNNLELSAERKMEAAEEYRQEAEDLKNGDYDLEWVE
jgi:hypothetical protein